VALYARNLVWMKSKLVLLLTGCLVWLMSSCLGDDSYSYEYELPRNCQLATFTLSHDTIPTLAKTKFTIDQLGGLVFNLDSLPYGTKMGKVICKVTYVSSSAVSGIQVIQEAVGDTINWNGTDSLDFSQPVRFIVHSYDGTVTKRYDASVNVHTLVPDSLVWSLHANRVTPQTMKEQTVIQHTYQGSDAYFLYGEPAGTDLPYRLYYSPVTDAKNWTEITLEGLPTGQLHLSQMTEYEGLLYVPSTTGVVYQSIDGQYWGMLEHSPSVSYLLGSINAGDHQGSALATIINVGGQLKFAAMSETRVWTSGMDVPDEFPINGFGNENFKAMYYDYLMLVGGRTADNQLVNSAWATLDGKSWAILTDEASHYFERMEGAMVKAYDDKIYMIGGINAAGQASKYIYETIDKGVTWAKVDSMVTLPETFRERGFGSILVDREQYLTIFGGKMTSNGNVIQEIWKGRINKFAY